MQAAPQVLALLWAVLTTNHDRRATMPPHQPNHNQPENWKPVVGYEGLYEVSDWGNVRSLARTVTRSDGRVRPFPSKVLSQGFSGERERPLVALCKNGKQTTKWVHRLVAEAFLGPAPDGMEACHRNDDCQDNRPENLYWGTRSDNLNDMVANGLHYLASRTHCKWGHEFTPENTVTAGRGRQCRACRAVRSRARR